MKPRVGPPADLMTLLVWLPLLVVGIGLAAACAMPVFNWLADPH